jgi:OOP family OmpA-OmpF porin
MVVASSCGDSTDPSVANVRSSGVAGSETSVASGGPGADAAANTEVSACVGVYRGQTEAGEDVEASLDADGGVELTIDGRAEVITGTVAVDGAVVFDVDDAGDGAGDIDIASCTGSGELALGDTTVVWNAGLEASEVLLDEGGCDTPTGEVASGDGTGELNVGGEGGITIGEDGSITLGSEDGDQIVVDAEGNSVITGDGQAIGVTKDGQAVIVSGDGTSLFVGADGDVSISVDAFCLSVSTDDAEVVGRDDVDEDVVVRENSKATVFVISADLAFDFNSATVRPDADAALDSIIEVLASEFKDASVTVIGHTDSIGTDAYNVDLSVQRADAVAALIEQRVGADLKINSSGLGESRPLAPNTNADGTDNPEGRAQNRRVEVVVRTAA